MIEKSNSFCGLSDRTGTTHTHTHAYIHTYIHTYTHTYVYTYIRTYTHTDPHTRKPKTKNTATNSPQPTLFIQFKFETSRDRAMRFAATSPDRRPVNNDVWMGDMMPERPAFRWEISVCSRMRLGRKDIHTCTHTTLSMEPGPILPLTRGNFQKFSELKIINT